VTELSRSPLPGSGTLSRGTSRQHRHWPSSAGTWRHISSGAAFRDVIPLLSCLRSDIWHFGHVNRSFYLLTLLYLFDQEMGVPQGIILLVTLFGLKINSVIKAMPQQTISLGRHQWVKILFFQNSLHTFLKASSFLREVASRHYVSVDQMDDIRYDAPIERS